MSDFSIIIKTFCRPEHLDNLLRSIEKNTDFCGTVIVVDDSPYRTDHNAGSLDLRVVRTMTDVGLSAGRNIGVRECSTPFFILMDDDFEVSKETQSGWARMLDPLRADEYDLVGGRLRGRRNPCHGTIHRARQGSRTGVFLYKEQGDKDEKGLIKCDYVLNYFAARTESVLCSPWRDEIKIGMEHIAFFYQAKKKGIRVAQSPDSWISDAKNKFPMSKTYKRKRGRHKNYVNEALSAIEADGFAHISKRRKLERKKGRFNWLERFETEEIG